VSETETDSAINLDFDDTEEKQEGEPTTEISSSEDKQVEEKSTLFGVPTPAVTSASTEAIMSEDAPQGMFRDPGDITPTTSQEDTEETIPLSQNNESSPEQIFTSPFASMHTTQSNEQETVQEDLPKEPGALNIDDLVIESTEEGGGETDKTSNSMRSWIRNKHFYSTEKNCFPYFYHHSHCVVSRNCRISFLDHQSNVPDDQMSKT
jgi:hypothetical protein